MIPVAGDVGRTSDQGTPSVEAETALSHQESSTPEGNADDHSEVPWQDRARQPKAILLSQLVTNPHQPRREFDNDKLNELASSIKRYGLLQPILVKKTDVSCYMIVAGERRFRAHHLLGRWMIFCIVVTGDAQEIALVENLQRSDLHPLEVADALVTLRESHDYTHDDLAEILSKSRAWVSETIRLASIPDDVRDICRKADCSKSALLEVAKSIEQGDHAGLLADIQSGRAPSVRQARERRKTIGGAVTPAAVTEPAMKLSRALASGRKFIARLDEASEDAWAVGTPEFAALDTIARRITEYVGGVRALAASS